MHLFLVTVMTLSAAAQERLPPQDVKLYIREKEAALGASLAQEVRKNEKMLESPAAREYVEQMGRLLAAQAPEISLTYTFEVTARDRDGLCIPAGLPGGYIFVPACAFRTSENDAEFAGLLAHAMAHSAARHGTRHATRGQVMNLSSVPLIFMGGWYGFHGGDADALLVPRAFLASYREYELEADRLAVGWMAGAGYDPLALVNYVDRLPVDKGPAELSSMPPREERIAQLRQTIADLAVRQYNAATGHFVRIREEVRATAATLKPERRAPTLRRASDR
jgi:predicted Zn-dependent protease